MCFACITTFFSYQRSVFRNLNPRGMSSKIFSLNSQFVKHVGNRLWSPPSKQSWKVEKKIECWGSSVISTSLWSCWPALHWHTEPSLTSHHLVFSSSALPLLPTGHVWPSSRHPPDRALRLTAGRFSAQGKRTASSSHAQIDKLKIGGIYSESCFDLCLVLSRPLIHSMCPQDLEPSHTHSYRRTPG